MSDQVTEQGTVTYARVGGRFHLVVSEAVYTGQPEVSLCGSVFIRATGGTDDLPLCFDCHVREVDRLRALAERDLDAANALALSLRSTSPGQADVR